MSESCHVNYFGSEIQKNNDKESCKTLSKILINGKDACSIIKEKIPENIRDKHYFVNIFCDYINTVIDNFGNVWNVLFFDVTNDDLQYVHELDDEEQRLIASIPCEAFLGFEIECHSKNVSLYIAKSFKNRIRQDKKIADLTDDIDKLTVNNNRTIGNLYKQIYELEKSILLHDSWYHE